MLRMGCYKQGLLYIWEDGCAGYYCDCGNCGCSCCIYKYIAVEGAEKNNQFAVNLLRIEY